MDTNALIAELANSFTPVRRLPAPWARMLMWLALSVPFLTGVIWLMMPSGINPVAALADRQFLIEEAILLVTASTAALAAFGSVVPGYDRRILRPAAAARRLARKPRRRMLAQLGRARRQRTYAAGRLGLPAARDPDRHRAVDRHGGDASPRRAAIAAGQHRARCVGGGGACQSRAATVPLWRRERDGPVLALGRRRRAGGACGCRRPPRALLAARRRLGSLLLSTSLA
jgi:hypothetical protein